MKRCRVCNCTDRTPCHVLDVPCCWVEEDLCSACSTVSQLLRSEDLGLQWLITVMGEYAGRVLRGDQQIIEVPMIWKQGA